MCHFCGQASSSKPKPATEEVKAAEQVTHFSSVDNWDSSSATEEEVKEVPQANENAAVDHFKKSLTDMIMVRSSSSTMKIEPDSSNPSLCSCDLYHYSIQ